MYALDLIFYEWNGPSGSPSPSSINLANKVASTIAILCTFSRFPILESIMVWYQSKNEIVFQNNLLELSFDVVVQNTFDAK